MPLLGLCCHYCNRPLFKLPVGTAADELAPEEPGESNYDPERNIHRFLKEVSDESS